jgi:hypothetical protein
LLRLPTITELRNFFNRLAYQQESGIKIFSELFTFQEESALFATSEILSGTDLIKCLRVSRYNLSVTEEIIDIGEEANFLLIKKNIP